MPPRLPAHACVAAACAAWRFSSCSAVELLQAACPWKEFTAENGTKYYHNATTNETSWTRPKVPRIRCSCHYRYINFQELDEVVASATAEEQAKGAQDGPVVFAVPAPRLHASPWQQHESRGREPRGGIQAAAARLRHQQEPPVGLGAVATAVLPARHAVRRHSRSLRATRATMPSRK